MTIGFEGGRPENTDRKWESEIEGITYIFTKARQNDRVVLYRCERKLSSGAEGPYSSFYSDIDYTPEEIENMGQFVNIIERQKKVGA
jgi:hypothetical protein